MQDWWEVVRVKVERCPISTVELSCSRAADTNLKVVLAQLVTHRRSLRSKESFVHNTMANVTLRTVQSAKTKRQTAIDLLLQQKKRTFCSV